MTSSLKPSCVVLGAGPGNGAAFTRRFAGAGHPTACLSRSQEKMDSLASGIEGARGFACDASEPSQVRRVLEQVAEEMGPIGILVYNAGSGVFGSIDEVESEALEQAWRLNTLGLHAAARSVAPAMKETGGSIVVVGATASLRGGAKFAAFAQAKAAQRSLAQSMARHWGPQGIHVGLLIINGVVDTPRTREMMPDWPEDRRMDPAGIAEAAFQLAHQPRSAWTFEMDLRASAEPW